MSGFQKTFGLSPDGIVGEETWRLLYSVSSEISERIAAVQDDQEYPGTPLQEGSQGTGVELMKRYYNRIASYYGNLPTVTENSVFDQEFSQAIRSFQEMYGLEPDGIIGALTWTRIVELYNFIRNTEGVVNAMSQTHRPTQQYPGMAIRRGIKGRHVKYIQNALNTVYRHIGMRKYLGITGEYGTETENAIIGYQKRRGLVADGIVGENTWNVLFTEAEGYDDGNF